MKKTTTEKIRQWAIARNLQTGETAKQMVKLMEEVGELASGMARDNINKIIDSIGDAYVVLTILALQYGIDIEMCIDEAYETIKDRKGKLVNGIFVKEEDL